MEQRELEWRSPVEAFASFAGRPHAVLLHTCERAEEGRWSFIAIEPGDRIETRGAVTRLNGVEIPLSPFAALKQLHADRRTNGSIRIETPLATGVIGYVGYECVKFIEPTITAPPSPFRMPDLSFCAYDAIAAFDRIERRLIISGRTAAAAEKLALAVGDAPANPELPRRRPEGIEFDSNFSRADYERAVASVVERIRCGELFQANISQRLTARVDAHWSAFHAFQSAATEGSAPFAAFFSLGDDVLFSLSPERFFSISRSPNGKRRIVAEPIKGSRPRGKTREEDVRLLGDLVTDPKERAENIMIADLTRNDLSRICGDHTVCEAKICEPVTYAEIHHLVSRIEGDLREEVDAVDALRALFPCGSVTGAPKMQAMTVIAETEGVGRGPYCGAIGYVDDRGGADFSVAIRSAIVDGGMVHLPIGGGVTLRSDPSSEYFETLNKARWFAGASKAFDDDINYR